MCCPRGGSELGIYPERRELLISQAGIGIVWSLELGWRKDARKLSWDQGKVAVYIFTIVLIELIWTCSTCAKLIIWTRSSRNLETFIHSSLIFDVVQDWIYTRFFYQVLSPNNVLNFNSVSNLNWGIKQDIELQIKCEVELDNINVHLTKLCFWKKVLKILKVWRFTGQIYRQIRFGCLDT